MGNISDRKVAQVEQAQSSPACFIDLGNCRREVRHPWKAQTLRIGRGRIAGLGHRLCLGAICSTAPMQNSEQAALDPGTILGLISPSAAVKEGLPHKVRRPGMACREAESKPIKRNIAAVHRHSCVGFPVVAYVLGSSHSETAKTRRNSSLTSVPSAKILQRGCSSCQVRRSVVNSSRLCRETRQPVPGPGIPHPGLATVPRSGPTTPHFCR